MDVFIKATAGTLLALILYLSLKSTGNAFAFLLSVAVICMIVGLSATFLQPIIDFVEELITLGQFDSEMLEIVMKSVGVGLLSEIAVLICTDAGNSALGKALQILASAVVLWLSVPLFTSLIELVKEILGAV